MPSQNIFALNYEYDTLQFLVGSFDITNYVDDFTIGLPSIDITTPQLYTGSFSLSLNERAIADGVSDSTLSEFFSPTLWRKGQQKIVIIINGFTLPILRIEEYKYDDVDHTGEGQLAQLPSFFNGFSNKELASVSPKVGGTNLGQIVTKLLEDIRPKVPGGFVFDTPSLSGSYDLPVYFDDIAQRTQQFCGTQMFWLWCNNTERLSFVKANLVGTANLFRSQSKFESTRNTSSLNFAAEIVKVNGNKEVASNPPPLEEPGGAGLGSESNSSTPEGYPQSYSVITNSTYGDVFGDLKDNFGNSLLTPGNIDTPIVSQIDIYYYTYGGYGDGSLYRVSELISTRKLAGTMYGKLTDDNGLPLVTSISTASILEFSETVTTEAKSQTTVSTKGQLYADAKSATGTTVINSLGVARQMVAKRQELSAEVANRPPYFVPPSPKNPNTGGSVGAEPQPSLEAPQPQAEFDYETQIYSATCQLEPTGWSSFLPKELSIDVGFVPSQTVAQSLVCFIAKLEVGRRDATDYLLPIANEWLANGGRPFQLAYMRDALCLIDQPIIEGKRNGDSGYSLEFTFTGIFLGRLGLLPDAPPPLPVPLVGFGVVPIAALILEINVAIAPITFVAVGGTLPYTWVASGLPPGLSLSIGGVLNGAPTALSAGTATIAATDALLATASFGLLISIVKSSNPDQGTIQVVRLSARSLSGANCVLGLRGFGTTISNVAISTGNVVDVTLPPIVSRIQSLSFIEDTTILLSSVSESLGFIEDVT